MDADWSHDPKYLPAMARRGAAHDVVIGSRYLRGVSVVNWPLRRIMLSAFANRYIGAVTGLTCATAPAASAAGGARRWRSCRSTACVDGYAFLAETRYEAHVRGARIGEVPIIFVERRMGASKLSGGVLLESG